MSDLLLGISVLVVVFVLLIVLGIQIQIRTLGGKIDQVLQKLDSK